MKLVFLFLPFFLEIGCQSCEKTVLFLKENSLNCVVDTIYVDKANRGYKTIGVTKISGFQPEIGLDGYVLPDIYNKAKVGDTIVKEKGSLRFVLKRKDGGSIVCYPVCEGKYINE